MGETACPLPLSADLCRQLDPPFFLKSLPRGWEGKLQTFPLSLLTLPFCGAQREGQEHWVGFVMQCSMDLNLVNKRISWGFSLAFCTQLFPLYRREILREEPESAEIGVAQNASVCLQLPGEVLLFALGCDVTLVQAVKARNGVSEVGLFLLLLRLFASLFFFCPNFLCFFIKVLFLVAELWSLAYDRQVSLGCGYRQLSPLENGLLVRVEMDVSV